MDKQASKAFDLVSGTLYRLHSHPQGTIMVVSILEMLTCNRKPGILRQTLVPFDESHVKACSLGEKNLDDGYLSRIPL